MRDALVAVSVALACVADARGAAASRVPVAQKHVHEEFTSAYRIVATTTIGTTLANRSLGIRYAGEAVPVDTVSSRSAEMVYEKGRLGQVLTSQPELFEQPTYLGEFFFDLGAAPVRSACHVPGFLGQEFLALEQRGRDSCLF
jgi:hypothetical protein